MSTAFVLVGGRGVARIVALLDRPKRKIALGVIVTGDQSLSPAEPWRDENLADPEAAQVPWSRSPTAATSATRPRPASSVSRR